ncbi:histidine triad nucleotide-binding protein [Patescibacteria group bacterium]|nr:histidine triad nucleotide-binding protein [Patescibacteria group bacterium]
MDCIFCSIAQKKIPAQVVFEDERFVAFKDINPKAPIHILIVPKTHITSVNDLTSAHQALVGDMILLAQKLAAELHTSEGYKLCFNVGRKGGQIIDHLHLHLLGGWHHTGESSASHV